MAETQTLQVQTHVHGDVPEDAMDLAVMRVRAVLRQAPEPVLFARVKLTKSPDPAVDLPAVAQANIDMNGRPIRAQAAAATMRDAIEMLSEKLRVQLERGVKHWARLRASQAAPPGGPGAPAEPGKWRHQSVPTPPLPYFPRPVDERGVIRHKSYGLAKMTPDEAVADMELLDYDFHLFTERSTNQDSVVYRSGAGYRIAQIHPKPERLAGLSEEIAVSEVPAPKLSIEEAESRLEEFGNEFVFFLNPATGRGNVVYHRYDGDYGLITPADAELSGS